MEGFRGMAPRSSTASVHDALDPSCCTGWVLVFPHPNDLPPGLSKPSISVTVTLPVPPELLFPPLGVRSWACPVLRARMPEAPIDHHRNSTGSEDDVGAPPQPRNRRSVDSVAEAQSM